MLTHRAYGPRDDAPAPVGDDAWQGVNDRISRERLPAGLLARALNLDLDAGDLRCRPGYVCEPTLNVTPLGTAYGEAPFVDAAGLEWLLVLNAGEVKAYRRNHSVRTIAVPAGYTATAAICTLVQALNRVFIFQAGAAPLEWSGVWGEAFVAVSKPAAIPATRQIPDAATAMFFQNRLWLPYTRNQLAVSDLLDFTRYDPVTQDFTADFGAGDAILTLAPYGEQSVVIFKSRSIGLLRDVTPSLASVRVDELTRAHGLAAQQAWCEAAGDIYYLASDRSLRSLSLTINNELQRSAEPWSAPVPGLFRRINWQAIATASLATDGEKLYLAVPMDDATAPNRILIYSLIRRQWDGEWAFASGLGIAIRQLIPLSFNGVRRLHLVSAAGRVYAPEGGCYDLAAGVAYGIAQAWSTRGYRLPGGIRVRPAEVLVALATYSPNITLNLDYGGPGEDDAIATGLTYDRTRSHYGTGTADWRNASGAAGARGREDYSVIAATTGSGFFVDTPLRIDLQQQHVVRRTPAAESRWVAVEGAVSTGAADCQAVVLALVDKSPTRAPVST
jgi:hypothetical protein